jgi:LysM repeat protein
MHSRLKGLLAGCAIATVLAIGPSMTRPAAARDSVVVRAGDTLSGIAVQHGVTVEQLVSLNGIENPNRIYDGQTLRLKPVASTTPVDPPRAARSHAVRPGDTLTGIARRYGTSIQAIVAANGLPNANRIYAGQRLAIPGTAAAPKATPKAAPKPLKSSPAPAAAAPTTHRVQFGETLTGIARRYGTTIAAIVRANRIANPSFVRTGTILRIPGGASPTTGGASAKTAMPDSMARLVARRAAVRRVITEEAARFGVATDFALAVGWQESGWQEGLVSSAGAIGVMQLLPATGDWVGPGMLGYAVDLRDTRQNVRAGVRLLRHYLDRYHGDKARALAAYYQGQTAVDRHGIYAVSRPYIASILHLERFFD